MTDSAIPLNTDKAPFPCEAVEKAAEEGCCPSWWAIGSNGDVNFEDSLTRFLKRLEAISFLLACSPDLSGSFEIRAIGGMLDGLCCEIEGLFKYSDGSNEALRAKGDAK